MPRAACNTISCGHNDKPFIFVSYSHQDAELVFPIIDGVAAGGYQIWYDKGINISSTWTDEIAIAIMNCQVVVVFFSKAAVASSYVRAEVEYALNHKIKIIPVYLDGMEVLPPGLALGLNATQGITEVKSRQRIIAQIREALAYNQVEKRGQERAEAIEHKKPGKKLARRVLAPLLLAALLAGAVFFLRAPGPGAPAASGDFSLSKPAFTPAEPIMVSVAELSPKMIEQGALLGVCQPDAPAGEFLHTEIIAGKRVKLRAPLAPGAYQIRAYDNGDVLTAATMLAKIDFTVAGDACGAYSLEIDKSIYAPREDIVVRVKGAPRYMLNDGAMVGLYYALAPPDKFIFYMFIDERDRQITLDAPYEPGKYEVRSYANNLILVESTLVASAPFEVRAAAEAEAAAED